MDPRRTTGGFKTDAGNDASSYKEFNATELYCTRCRRAVPVRERLLLILPEGEKYEYLCALCGNSVGAKLDRDKKPMSIVF